MVLDTERNILAVENEYIFLSLSETLVLNSIIEHKKGGAQTDEIMKDTYPYFYHVVPVVKRLNQKIKEYAWIYCERRIRWKIKCYKKNERKRKEGKTMRKWTKEKAWQYIDRVEKRKETKGLTCWSALDYLKKHKTMHSII